MTIEQIKQLSKEIHEGNAKRGFWDEPRKMSEVLVLIRTEIDEAVEAHRKGRNADITKYKELEKADRFSTVFFCKFIKDTVEDELADVIIRILDLPTSGMIDTESFYRELRALGFPDLGYAFPYGFDCFLDMVDDFHGSMPTRKDAIKIIACNLAYSLCIVLYYCGLNNINIWWHVKEKLKYNETRPYKHGKKY